MSIKLNGATSGSVELDVPDAIGSDVSGVLLPTAAGTLDRLERAGNILQVVKYQRLGATTSLLAIAAGAGYGDVMTKDITTTVDNSKILVVITYTSYNSTRGSIQILRDSSQISADPYAHYTNSTSVMVNYSSTIEDAPAVSAGTTLTYKLQAASGTGVCIFGYGDSAGGGSAILALMEIAS